jgi:gamma-glutamyltranspeptidase
MRDILQPAITYAIEGFPVTEVIAYYLDRNTKALQEYRILKKFTCREAELLLKVRFSEIPCWPALMRKL